MKKKRWQPSAGFLRINLRRNETKGGFLVFLSFITIVEAGAFDDTTALTAELARGVVTVSARLMGGMTGEILSSLEDGLKSEIIFQFRLYHKNTGLFSLFGDRLIFEKKITRVAYFDIFEDFFVMETQGAGVQKFRQKEEFLGEFFQFNDYSLAKLKDENLSQMYVLARISLNPVRIVPPLNIISLFFTHTAVTTPWVESALIDRVSF